METIIEIGDSLRNIVDNKMYLVLQVDEDSILIEEVKGNKYTIANDATTLSKFEHYK